MQDVRTGGHPTTPAAIEAMNAWAAFFSAATTQAVADAESFERRVTQLNTVWRGRLGDLRSHSAALRLLEQLPATPVLTVNGAAALIGRSFRATNDAVEQLVAAHILTPAKAGQRNRVFEARELIDAFTGLEREIASPTGDTRTAEPERRVPARPQRDVGTER